MIPRSCCTSAIVLLLTSATCLAPRAQAAKVYDRCELARELRDVHELPQDQIGTWVCIARHESEYNTSAINKSSGDHGLFQISELFWCSPPGAACGVSCDSLKDDDIEDDVVCARRIFRQHQRLHGDGFLAWIVYNQHCRNAKAFVDDCWTKEDNAVTKKDGEGNDLGAKKETNAPEKIKDDQKIVDVVAVVDIEDEVVKVDVDECSNVNDEDAKSIKKECNKKPKPIAVNKGRQIKISSNYEFTSIPRGFKLVFKKPT